VRARNVADNDVDSSHPRDGNRACPSPQPALHNLTPNAPAQAGRGSGVGLSTKRSARPCLKPHGWTALCSFDDPRNKLSDAGRNDRTGLQPVLPIANRPVAMPEKKVSV
jgi:hypothetical protein